ncbi:MAG: hypothetical protein ABI970_26925 [Chloroflexota bacterium]
MSASFCCLQPLVVSQKQGGSGGGGGSRMPIEASISQMSSESSVLSVGSDI